VAGETGCRIHIEHINSTGGTGRMVEAIAQVDAARAEGLSITDDTAACEAIGQAVKLIECDTPNPKATTPADLPYIESLLAGE
jgi:2-C-methyl-D-erythritol 4-phosphate cytidylyltransferase